VSTDRDLVLGLRRADRRAFAEVYRVHHARIWRFLVRLTDSAGEAEDIFQETWLAAARHAQELREDTALLPWLYTIARNKHRNALRFRFFEKRRREELGWIPSPREVRPDEAAETRTRAERTELALAHLPRAHREVLLLCLVEGLATAEVAGVLGIREEAVRKRLSRARQELGKRLGIERGDGK
jgi:RNA polymerase sigma factor (sigma-70 family)